LSPSRNFHWIVRITNETKNGRRMRSRIDPFHRPP
jgi:hypothetical protein